MSGRTGPGHASHSADRAASFSPGDRDSVRTRVRTVTRIRIRVHTRLRVRVHTRVREGGKIPILREKSLHPRRILEMSLPRRS